MAVGKESLSLLELRLRLVSFLDELKSNSTSVPPSSVPERSISDMLPATSQTMPVQLQRFPMLARDHDEFTVVEENKVFFHLTRASACVIEEYLVLKGSKDKKRR